MGTKHWALRTEH